MLAPSTSSHGPQVLYISCAEIYRFLKMNPIDYGPYPEARERPPTPVVPIFVQFLHEQQQLFSQQAFLDRCRVEWQQYPKFLQMIKESPGPWWRRLCGQLYPSCIQSLYLAALLCETRQFGRIAWATNADVYLGKDLIVSTVWHPDVRVSISLRLLTSRATAWAEHKQKVRGKLPTDSEVLIPRSCNKIGNMDLPQIAHCHDVFRAAGLDWQGG